MVITWYMPCESHDLQELKEPCQEGYEMIGFKMKDGKRVPNCVPLSELNEDSRPFLNDELAHEMLDALADLGEEEPEGYELIDAEIVGDDEPEEFDTEEYLNGLVNLSATQDSNQDSEIYKVRYKYVKGTKKTSKGSSRSFLQDYVISKENCTAKRILGRCPQEVLTRALDTRVETILCLSTREG